MANIRPSPWARVNPTRDLSHSLTLSLSLSLSTAPSLSSSPRRCRSHRWIPVSSDSSHRHPAHPCAPLATLYTFYYVDLSLASSPGRALRLLKPMVSVDRPQRRRGFSGLLWVGSGTLATPVANHWLSVSMARSHASGCGDCRWDGALA